MTVFLPGKSHEQRSLVGYSPWDHKRVRHNSVTKEQQLMYNTVCYMCTIQQFTTFKGYTPFIVMIKYWLQSPCGTIYLVAYFTHNLLISYPSIAPPNFLFPLVTSSLYRISVSLLFCYLHEFVVIFTFHQQSDIRKYLSFSVWFLSFNTTSSKSIPAAANGKISFSFGAEQRSILYVHSTSLSIHL